MLLKDTLCLKSNEKLLYIEKCVSKKLLTT